MATCFNKKPDRFAKNRRNGKMREKMPKKYTVVNYIYIHIVYSN